MRVLWVTDIHLNFLRPSERGKFYLAVRERSPDIVLITGDIAEAPCLQELLQEMQQAVNAPIYFVLGNHDFYHGSIESGRCEIQNWCLTQSGLQYLSVLGPIELTARTVLVGHDGWGDGRLGHYHQTPVRLSDQELIRDFHGLDRDAILRKLQALGDESAAYLRDVLNNAMDSYERVYCLIHVPPFKEACWYEGQPGNDDWLPYFTCHAVGSMLLDVTQARPNCQVTVLCGHTHHEGTAQMLPNLQVLTGSADYGAPCISRVFEIS